MTSLRWAAGRISANERPWASVTRGALKRVVSPVRPVPTPACGQSRSLRQQLMPEPRPISCASLSQRMPDCRTNRMPLGTAWSSSGLRPGSRVRRGFDGGRSGGIGDHDSSSRIGVAVAASITERTASDHLPQPVLLGPFRA
ncbi:hypothetical protein DO70_2049 [Burkholderia pseudomallei]|nr:hypothetical protein DO70_2049 [Burkholderia pseudomallei]